MSIGHIKNLMKTSINSEIPTDAFLQANNEAYEWLVEKIQSMDSRVDAEAVLQKIVVAARFAAIFHPGRFADGAIENVAFEIGTKLRDDVAEGGGFLLPVARNESRRRILHVATDVLGIGGHTRMLCHWVREDRSSCHSVLLLSQPEETPIPSWLSDAVKSSGGELLVFPMLSGLCQKAKWLRETSRRIADLIVMHHCPFDVVPTVAFAVKECPPVAVLNHADHLFWLGSSVTDVIINLRTVGAEHSAMHRFVGHNTVLPIPLTMTTKKLSRKDARQTLKIPENQVVLLSIGRAEKYRPSGEYDFVATAGKILKRQPDAHLYVVGESVTGISPYLRCALHERLHFLGSIDEPSLYRAAADIYLESFPFGSQTALLEAALCGLPVIPAYAPLFPLLVANDDAVHDLLPNPIHEEEYRERVDFLIKQPSQREELGMTLQSRLLVDHTAEGWLKKLAVIYEEIGVLTHIPKSIPITQCGTTNASIGLSQWHIVADGKTHSTGVPVECLEAVLCHTAFVTKEVGNYATARRYAWNALWQNPIRWSSWLLLGVTLMGKIGPSLRRMMAYV